MFVSVVPIGDLKGICIPDNILEKLGIQDEVELEFHGKDLLLKPVAKKLAASEMVYAEAPECDWQ